MNAVDLKIEECAKELAMDSAHIPAIKSVLAPYFARIKKLLWDGAYSAGYHQGRFKKEKTQEAKEGISITAADVWQTSMRNSEIWKQSAMLVEENYNLHDYEI